LHAVFWALTAGGLWNFVSSFEVIGCEVVESRTISTDCPYDLVV
jgi:hypothetical protein